MKAIRIHKYGDSGTLQLEEAPILSIQSDHILVRVRDAGVNPIDWKIRAGYLRNVTPAAFPMTMGQDFAGDVVERGKDVLRFNTGDRVFGFAHGTYAEYAAAPASTVAMMPKNMTFEIGAALPTPGLTALQLVRDVVGVKVGMTILIHGAAGSVGSFTAQIARRTGAHIIGTATGEADIAWLKSLGVEQVIDFHQERFEEKVRGVDGVVDLVGGDTLARSYAVVKKGGVLATTVQPIDEAVAKQTGIRAVQVMMKRNAADLAELAKFVDQGVLKARLGKTLSLAQAKEAQELGEKGKARGKLVLKVA